MSHETRLKLGCYERTIVDIVEMAVRIMWVAYDKDPAFAITVLFLCKVRRFFTKARSSYRTE